MTHAWFCCEYAALREHAGCGLITFDQDEPMSLHGQALEYATDAIGAAQARGDHFPSAWSHLDLDDACRVLLELSARRARSGDARVGWKVGLTAPAIQAQFGVHEPVFGCLFASGRVASGHVFDFNGLIAPGFENEILVALSSDVSPDATQEEVNASIDWIAPALEIIETRGDFTRQLALAIADNAQQKAFVVGEPVAIQHVPDLARVQARVSIDGVEVASGTGDAVLGHPFYSVRWLARRLAALGERLRAGDLVMSGSFTRQFALAAGNYVETRFEGVGAVSARFD